MLGDKGRKIYPARSEVTDILSQKMRDAWASFAGTGDPSHRRIPAWEPYDLEKRKTMLFGTEIALTEDPFGPERMAWEGII
jgi:para-nitrobenzyl esterase